MYKINRAKDHPAHREGYGDDWIVCFASAHTEFIQKTIDWVVPKCLKNDFEAFINVEPIEDERDKNIWEKYKNWFIEKLSLKSGSIHIGFSKRFFSRDIEYKINNDNIKYNKKDLKIENIKCNENYMEYVYNNFYEKNYTTAYIVNNQLMAMVSVREDGKIINSLPNVPVYDKIEYITLCIKRLVNEFKIFNKKIYINVWSFEKEEQEIMKQMEMECLGYNYHFSFDLPFGRECSNDGNMLKRLYEK
jgi:hypothetical protein